jgi:hypothetical protein
MDDDDWAFKVESRIASVSVKTVKEWHAVWLTQKLGRYVAIDEQPAV